ncbi:MAG: glycosyl hydrolase [Acidimicrobiales bacterium]
MNVPKLDAIIITIMLIITLTLSSYSKPADALTSQRLGVFRGSGQVEEVASYEKWLGKETATVVDFVGRAPKSDRTPWGDIDNPTWWCNRWKAKPSRLVLSTAILPNEYFSLAEGARGDYNSHWKNFAANLVASGCPDATLRLGWEFNGKFYPWAAGGKETYFAAYWRQIVDTIRKVPGQKFLFDWNPLAGNSNAKVEAAYPGEQYVDVIGLDSYDTSTVSPSSPDKRWADQLNRVYGLAWHATFAEKMKKPMSFPEWGITVRKSDTLGGGDNPSYITNMWQWIHSHNVLYTAYFEVDANDASHRLMTSKFPKASVEYRRLVKAGV